MSGERPTVRHTPAAPGLRAEPSALGAVLEAVASIANERSNPRPFLIGIAGAVAVGKTSIADALAVDLGAVVVSTDGFLLPNIVLGERSAMYRKGFPDTYDEKALAAFLDGLRAGHRVVEAPLYSHERYDVDPVRRHRIENPTVVIVEGVNVLQPVFADRLHCRIYVDAAEEHVEAWYVDRFLRLCEDAVDDESSFYRQFATLSVPEQLDMAEMVWAQVNGPNLRDHIAPTRAGADIVVTKDATHAATVRLVTTS